MKKLFSTILVLGLLLSGNAYSKDTPYMKLLNSYEGVDRMLVCTPLMQKVSSNFKKGLQIKIQDNNYDVKEYIEKIANPPSKFKSLDSMVFAYHNAILMRMVGENWIAIRMPKEEKAKKAYQKNHISNEAVILVSKLSYKDLGPYLSKCDDIYIQLKKENNTVKKYDEILTDKAFEEVYKVLNKFTVKKQNTSSKKIIHLACTIDPIMTLYDLNLKETKYSGDTYETIFSFDLDKQILLDTNFQKHSPMVASIDDEYIRWHFGEAPSDQTKGFLKTMYNQEIVYSITDRQINRYSGKYTEDSYELDSFSLIYFGGGTVKDGVAEVSNKLEFNSPEGLKNRQKHIAYSKFPRPQNKGVIHTSKITGDCKTTTKTKKF